MHVNTLIVEVRNADLERVGQILPKDIKSLLLEDQFNNVGSWELAIASDHPLAPALREPGAGIIVSTGDGQVLLSGPTIKPESAVTVEDVKGTLTVSGLTDTVLLADRLAFPEPGNINPETQSESHDVRIGPAETLMHEYVSANIGPNAPEGRRDPRLQMGVDGGRGPVVTKRARFPVLGDLVNELAVVADLGFRIVQVGDKLEFQTFEVVDRSGSIRLDVRNNMLAGHRVAIGPPGATRAIVAGQGEQVERTFVEVTTPDSLAAEELWKRRIERFVDQRNTDDPEELTQAGLEELAEAGFSQLAAQVVPMEDFSLEYGHEWLLGDRIAVVVDGQEMTSIVTGFVLRRGADGFRMGAILGDPYVGSPSQRLNKVEARVSNLERGVETVVDVGPRLASLENAASGFESDIDNLESAVEDLENDLDELAQDVSELASSLAMTGEIRLWAGETAPNGWHLCDGTAVSRTTYSTLFSIIGTRYGSGNGSTTFNLPNLKGRVPVGLDGSQSEFNALGKTGGAKTHTLTTAEMPQHNHSVSLTTSANGLHQHPIGADTVASGSGRIGMHVPGNQQGNAGNNQTGTYFEGDHTHTVSGNTGDAGGGQPHNNLQPYVVINYIIKL